MSSALLRKSLRLFEDDLTEKGKKKRKTDQRNNEHTEQKGITRWKTNKKKNPKQKGVVNLEEIRKELQLKKNFTEENLKRLQILRYGQIDQAIANKILERASKCTKGDKNLKTEDTTVFTEEDFKNFEEEYIDT
ncbi:uncharacterized protein LOC126354162 isoform X1 [Schistocerca gregaria]|uniref:uncharacterized protein LOC126354162 isoform X1 n=1 Tax=Schistocerca gregaria TaxID=7010 RepID=UPI00211E5087|nr:uncharacterized protein LOC126354162 isoform X1 [Schistocerca gregaria]